MSDTFRVSSVSLKLESRDITTLELKKDNVKLNHKTKKDKKKISEIITCNVDYYLLPNNLAIL